MYRSFRDPVSESFKVLRTAVGPFDEMMLNGSIFDGEISTVQVSVMCPDAGTKAEALWSQKHRK